MIKPITSEAEWSEGFEHLPSWSPPRDSMLVIAPHPDDEILGIGGLIAAQIALGVEIVVVAVTDGENAYPDDPPGHSLGTVRTKEQTEALRRVGVPECNTIRLHLPDSGVTKQLDRLVEHVSPFVSASTHILAPWRGDFHPDHEACGIAAEMLAKRNHARLTSYFFWTWHRGTPDLIQNLPLCCFPLDVASQRAKANALQCHQSQLVRKQGDEILPNYLLGPAQRPFEIFLVHDYRHNQ